MKFQDAQSNKADTNDITQAVDTVCDDLVFKHEKREPAITDWCCLREQSVREAITNLIAQETNKAEQQLLTELLRSAKEYEKWVGGNQATGRAITVRAVPVSVIERLQNKTNDGGSDGG